MKQKTSSKNTEPCFSITSKTTCKNSGTLRKNNFIQNHHLHVARFFTKPFNCSPQYTCFRVSLKVTS